MKQRLFTIEVVAGELLTNALQSLCDIAQTTVVPSATPTDTMPSRDDVKPLLVELQKSHGTTAVVEVLQRFDAKKLSDVADDALADVLAEVQGRLAS